MATRNVSSFFRRYPWAGGYTVAPFTFIYARGWADRMTSNILPVGPLFASSSGSPGFVRFVATSAFLVHFFRRLVEVFVVNDYCGSFERNSIVEFAYYALWGVLGGLAVGNGALQQSGTAPFAMVCCGIAVFTVGEIGNAWSHWHLRTLRSQKRTLGTGTYVIPTAGPFSYISCPHYTFELLSWSGYAIISGVETASLTFLCLSVIILVPFARDRHVKYVRMLKDGCWDGSGQRPDAKWKMVPFMW
mmetsp:Transcript_24676/g.55583  ORF Transcript_24676/g.55583 Transcript_24676/m.55583 type:complete len:246 (+) Transcript_24676:35-772(+)